MILAIATALIASIASGGVVYTLSSRSKPNGGTNPATGTVSSRGPQDAAGAGDASAPAEKADAKADDPSASGDGDSGAGSGGSSGSAKSDTGSGDTGGSGGTSGSGGSGESAGGNVPVTSNDKGTGGSGETGDSSEDDTGAQPDGPAGMIDPRQPDPGKGGGGPPYLNEPAGEAAAPATAAGATSEEARLVSSAAPKATVTPAAKAAVKPAAGAAKAGGSSAVRSVEDEVVRLTNIERRSAGCSALRNDEKLRVVAQGHSDDMAAKGYFDHDSADGRSPLDRIEAAGYTQGGAENIAQGQSTPADVVDAWMESPGHRANILNCELKAIGVGVHLGGTGPYWTQDFGFA